MECCEVKPRIIRGERFDLTIALAGNANVGKSVIFNALTGMNQIIGNWPGKTVELAEGSFDYKGKHIRVVDLPGIYSLSTYSQEEVISREFIAEAQPDVVVNVVDSTVLERNLYFTLQLRELGAPLVTALNLIDLAAREGLVIDESKLSSLLGVPVVRTSGAAGKGTGRSGRRMPGDGGQTPRRAGDLWQGGRGRHPGAGDGTHNDHPA